LHTSPGSTADDNIRRQATHGTINQSASIHFLFQF
jgi:hypothetical protein